MARIAFLGLGQMGAPMANRLLDADHDLTVWNRTEEKANTLADRGATLAASPADAAKGQEIVITMLATPDALDEVLFGDQGVAEGIEPNTTLIEMSTVGPSAFARASERLPDGVEVVDAPVLGSVPQATEGALTIFVGASEKTFERLSRVLSALGRPTHFGPPGAGAAMKLVVNSTLGGVMTTAAEALSLADSFGLDEHKVLDALEGSAIGATIKNKRRNIESDTYAPNFKLSLAVKDLGLVAEAAHDNELDLHVAPAAGGWYAAAEEAGLGDCDYSAVIAHVRGRPARP
jgi:3-hydroxyisobutyrate dehydrogenase-like beta-hydroxyacid dehydrogenase